MDNKNQFSDINNEINIREEISRYISFWPYLLLVIFISIFSSFLFLRYTNFNYDTTTVIEILDESQNSEMALPTELTVFNRSMINLENEINRFNSNTLNELTVKKIKGNVLMFHVGRIKNKLVTTDNWYDDFKIDFNLNTDLISDKSNFVISSVDNKLLISMNDQNDELVYSIDFNSLSTLSKPHELPFELTIISDDNLDMERKLKLVPLDEMVATFKKNLNVSTIGKDSDQLSLTLTYENEKIAQDYLNTLVKTFDLDGIADRELEYTRTIEFVNQREVILRNNLNKIELKKQNYKQENNISDVSLDANNNINLKYTYNSEIFQIESQKQISEYLIELISKSDYGYIPINIGLENLDLNNMISEYNKMITERYRYLNESGLNNLLVKSLESQLKNLNQNISVSLVNFSNSLNLKLESYKLKESEFDNEYNRVPESEKTLRAIERELSIKEALYLLLLQKREEASINLAVVKPTIKIIDSAITNPFSISPNPVNVYFISFIFSILLFFTILYIRFFFDNKIHHRDQLMKLLDPDISIIGEIPYIRDLDAAENDSKYPGRSLIAESVRMLLSNLRFTAAINDSDNNDNTVIIFTSSIKGEGKTLASVNTAIALANDLKRNKKVILLGTDLRNPQIHKTFGVDKSQSGISELIYKSDSKNYQNYLKQFDNLDVLFSGAIPPNPTALLSTNEFKKLISKLRNDYDHVIIDSAPCLLVSDTFQYIDLADSVVYLFRANFTDYKITNFINETNSAKKIKNLNIVFNSVGNSASYGYKYGYQYGYQYGYKYGYNYGYGYGYSEDK